MSEKRRWREGFIWWHRAKGHHIIKGFGVLSPATVYKCEDCELTWIRSLL